MRVKFKRPLGDENDKIVLTIAFLGGFIAIFFIRFLSDNFYPSEKISALDFVAIIIAIAVILAYTLYIGMTRNRSGISLDRGSDNVYYLGLLFTLASLSYSLIKLSLFGVSEREENEGVQVLSLLPDFGLALFSTIAGIFFRIVLQQLRNDPMDVETEAREELGIAIRQLRVTIGEVVGSLSSLSQQTSLTLTELNSAVSRTLEQTAQENTVLIDTVAKDISNLSTRLQQQVSQVEQFTASATASFTDILSTIRNEFEGFGNIPQLLSERFTALSNELQTTTDHVQTASQNQIQLSIELLNAVRSLQVAFSEDGVSRLSALIQDAEQRLEGINNDLQERGQNLVQTSQTLDAAVENIRNNSDSVSSVSDGMADAARSVNAASSDYIDEVARAADNLRRRTDDS